MTALHSKSWSISSPLALIVPSYVVLFVAIYRQEFGRCWRGMLLFKLLSSLFTGLRAACFWLAGTHVVARVRYLSKESLHTLLLLFTGAARHGWRLCLHDGVGLRDYNREDAVRLSRSMRQGARIF